MVWLRLKLCIIWGLPAIVLSQNNPRLVAEGPIVAYETVTIASVEMKAGETLSVAVSGNGVVLPYVITEVFKLGRSGEALLVDKENEEKKDRNVSFPFTWTSADPGRYYLRLRNFNDAAGNYTAAITQDLTARGSGEKEYAEVMVFYATNRKLSANPRPQSYYTAEPETGADLHYGELSVSIPRLDHHMGELEGPAVFCVFNINFGTRPDPNKHILVLKVLPEDHEMFFKRVAQRVRVSPAKQVLVFVHGFNISWDEAARRMAQIAYDLHYDGAPILFSWPSQGTGRLKDLTLAEYNKDGDYNELSVPAFEQFLLDIQAKTGAQNIQILAHSMGNRLLLRALEALSTRNNGTQRLHVTEIMMMAPDVSATLFQSRVSTVAPASKRFTIYGSENDRALAVAEKLGGGKRVGQGGKDILVVRGMDSVDVSALDTTLLGLNHNYYGDSSTIIYDLDQLIQGRAASSRLCLRKAQNKHGTYWEFVPARHN